jgi:hypothetical protein
MLDTLNLEERSVGIADGELEGSRYTVIQKDDRLYVVLPDHHPKEECVEIVKKLLKRLEPGSEVEVLTLGYTSTHCNYCLEPYAFPFKCHRCGGWYCQEHRLPERHDCPGLGKTVATAEYKVKEKEKKKKKVVAVELPCG